jgi:probable HAF family extracellular repeat protein
MTKQGLKNAVLSAGLLGLALSTSTSWAQVGGRSKLPASAAAQAASHREKAQGTPSYSYTVLAYPGSLSTNVNGINHGVTTSKIEIVGTAGTQGFIASVSEKKTTTEKYQALDYPHVSTQVTPIGINDSGQIVGTYVDSSDVSHGFVRNGVKFTTLAVTFAGATSTIPLANNDAGEIVGGWTDSGGVTHAFTLVGSTYTSFDYPGATYTQANDINTQGDIVGFYEDSSGVYHGFLLSGGTYTSTDFPGAIYTLNVAINDAGNIAGDYCTTSECLSTSEGEQGFVLSGGVFTSFGIPGEYSTYVSDMTNNGALLGAYVDAAGLVVSFMATP